ncbi:MAG: thiamine phosphate synthase [Muribaculaceae bacterium]|nr:thiamine phosphate synthase [Muribaculaceae bacterium]
MLQFITVNNIGVPVKEQVRLAIEGGCRWIQMSIDHLDEAAQREVAQSIMPLCEEYEVMMTIEHNVALVEELKVHGVHLFPGDMLPREVRAALGAHAVIGVTVTTAEEVISLRSADIDYVQIGPFPQISLEQYKEIASRLREADVQIPVVATGEISPEDVENILETGVMGVAVGQKIATSEDIAATVNKYLSVR